MSKELTLEEAENIVDNMYQNRWKECGVDDGNTIHMGNLDKLHYSELERASILLLRIDIRLKRENKKYKEVIDKAISQLDMYADILNNNCDAYSICVSLLDNLKRGGINE